MTLGNPETQWRKIENGSLTLAPELTPSFRVNIDGKKYRVQFRKAVVAQLMEETGPGGLVEVEHGLGVKYPHDTFDAEIGSKQAFKDLVKNLDYRSTAASIIDRRKRLWDKYFEARGEKHGRQ